MAQRQQQQDQSDIRVIANDIGYIKLDMQDVKKALSSNYVTVDQFDPIKRLVYGTVGLILSSFVVAVAAFFLGRV